MSTPTEETIYRFGPFTLHSDTEKFLLHKAGTPIYLSPQQFKTLLAFVQAEGRILTIEDLRMTAWNGWVAAIGTIQGTISELRRRLGDGTNDHIKTSDEGYQLAHEVRVDREGDVDRPPIDVKESNKSRGAGTITSEHEPRRLEGGLEMLLGDLPVDERAKELLLLGRRASANAIGAHQNSWLNFIEDEYGFFSEALDFFARSSPSQGVELANSLVHFWRIRGQWAEARERYGQMIIGYEPSPTEENARALAWLGYFSYLLDDLKLARQASSKALVISKNVEDDFGLAIALHGLGNLAQAEGRYEEVSALLEQSRDASERVNAGWLSAINYQVMGMAAQTHGDIVKAEKLYKERLEKSKQVDDRRGIASSYGRLCSVAVSKQDIAKARLLLENSQHPSLGAPGKQYVALISYYTGLIEEASNHPKEALVEYKKCADIRRGLGEKRGTAKALGAVAKMEATIGDEKGASKTLGTADALWTLSGASRSPAEESRYGVLSEDLRRKFPKEFEEARRQVLEGIVIVV